jgi:membrane peptidoglycan carboxypeptidase
MQAPLSRPVVRLGLAAVGLAVGVVALIAALHILLGSGKGRTVGIIHLRPLEEPSRVYDDHGDLLAVLQDADYRVPVPITQVSPWLRKAVVDVEDNTFYYHGAIDVRSIIRALGTDISAGQASQGGSTITQQLVKNSLLTPQKTFTRKLHEAILAYRLEQQMTKTQILERYMNTIYLGNGAYGVEAGAEIYFGLHASQLGPTQAALLAGLIRNPVGYDPTQHPVAARNRRNEALQLMAANHTITEDQANQLEATPLPTALNPLPIPPESAFVQEVKQTLLHDTLDFPSLGKTYQQRFNALFQGGLTITTTLDPVMQYDAGVAVNNGLPDTGGKFTAALVAEDPTNGYVRALVPGNSAANGYDVVTGRGGTGRQPGSSFKAFVLMAALDNGYSPADLVDGTSPCQFDLPHSAPYTGHNAEPGGGVMSVDQATYDSVNCAYMRIGLSVGLNKVVDMAHRLGIRSNINPVVTTSIGTADLTPLEMASAYATIADDGVYHHPTTVSKIVDRQGNVLYRDTDKGTRVVPAFETEVTTSVLQHVIAYGTGSGLGIGRPAAGKTGTATNFTNAWFIGYTPQLVAAVWMGSPQGNIPMYTNRGAVFGATYSGPIWQAFMQSALSGQPVLDFPAPDLSKLPAPKYIVAPYAPGSIPFGGVPGPQGPSLLVPPGFIPFSPNPSPTPPRSPQTTAPPTTPPTSVPPTTPTT